jgi:hypothetical protein
VVPEPGQQASPSEQLGKLLTELIVGLHRRPRFVSYARFS